MGGRYEMWVGRMRGRGKGRGGKGRSRRESESKYLCGEGLLLGIVTGTECSPA
jgi:hypothetical protein